MHAVGLLDTLESLPLSAVALLLADAVLKGTLLLCAAVLATALMRRRSAASRHLVWSLTVGALVLLPALSLVMPSLRVRLLPGVAKTAPSPALDVVTAPMPPAPSDDAEVASGPRPDGEAAPASSAPTLAATPIAPGAAPTPWWRVAISWWEATVVIWALGAIALLLRLSMGTLWVWRTARRASPVHDQRWLDVVSRAARELGLGRTVPVRVGEDVTTPMVCGVLAPTILLPVEALRWSAERRVVVALHELAHVKRGDAALEVVFQLARAIFWFHPLMWFAARQMRFERERACDDCVLATRTRPSVYADHLLDIVRTLGAGAQRSFAALAMARRSQFEGRLLAILDARQERGGVPARARALSASMALVVLLPLSAVDPWLDGRGVIAPIEPSVAMEALEALEALEPVEPAEAMEAIEPAPPDDVLPAVAVVSETPAAVLCAGRNIRGTWTHTNHQKSDGEKGRLRVIMAQDGRCLEVVAEGKLTFTEDEQDIAALGEDGFFSVSEEVGGTTRKLVVRPGREGELERKYAVNGTARALDAEGRAWFGRILLEVIRETGYDADARVKRLLARGGVKAVLAEVDLIRSSGGRARYLGVLLDEEEIGPDTLRIIAGMVGRDIASSGDKARLLTQIAEQPQTDSSVNPSIIEATETIASSGDQRRVLSSVVKTDGLESLILAARAARRIASSGDKTAVLLQIAERYEDDDRLRTEYLRTAASIAASGDRTRALLALLEQASLSQRSLLELLEAIPSIASSGDRTRVLVHVAENYSLAEPRLHAAFYTAVRGVPSSGDQRRALMAALGRDVLSEAELIAAIATSMGVASTSDRVSVLLAIVNSHGLRTAPVREAYLQAAESVASSSDYRRLMSAIMQDGKANLQL